MAVNIWEGEKAQALIDAVANGITGGGAKVDKYQGVGYAGKTLVVGSDGMVTFGNAGINDNAKLALIHCLQHMSFLNDEGPVLIERLQTELFSGGNDFRMAYEIPSGTDISAMAFDTHQRSFQVYEDFTFIAKCTINMSNNISTASQKTVTLVDSMVVVPGTSQLKGIRIIAREIDSKLAFTVFFNGWPNNGGGAGGTATGFSLDDEHNVIFIIKNQSKKVTVKIYVDGTLSLDDTEILADKAGDIITYHVGENAAETYMPWPGTIEMFRFYNVCLNNSEIEYLLNALFTGGINSRIVYEISHGTDISNWIIDTKQHAFTLNENFTFIANVTSNTVGADFDSMFLLDSLSQETPQVGARIQANISDGKISFRNIFNGGNANTTGGSGSGAGWSTSGDYLANEVHNLIFVLRNNNKHLTVRTYVDGALDYQDDTVCGYRSTTYPETYWIGQVRSGNKKPWKGIVNMYRIYNVALSDSEIERLLNISL